jgi:hypothetical protein
LGAGGSDHGGLDAVQGGPHTPPLVRDRCPYLLTFLACLVLLLGAGGLGMIGGAFAPEEAELSLEETEITESEDPTLAHSECELRPLTRAALGDLLAARPLPVARENPLRGAPPRDAWERPRRC